MRYLIAVILIIFALPATAAAQTDTPRVMVVGVFHFSSGGSDYINSEVDDYLSPQRQAEIETLVEQLAAFNPTKIVVELTPDHEDRFNQLYQSYLTGNHELTVNERQQIGMRLAARMGHDRLYAADFRSSMDFDAMTEAAAEQGQDHLLARLPNLRAVIVEMDQRLNRPDVTVSERIRVQNTIEMLNLHYIYLTLAQMGSAENPVGANEMTRWWGRNLQIFAQIAQLSEAGDRVLVIYGSGHKFLLDQFIQDAVELEWVDTLDYLPPE